MADLPLIPSTVVGSHGKPGWWFATVKAYEAGDRREGGPAQGAAECAREVAVGGGLGRARVDRALPRRAVEGREVEADDVVGVDPWQVLAPAGHGPAYA